MRTVSFSGRRLVLASDGRDQLESAGDQKANHAYHDDALNHGGLLLTA